MNLLAIETSSPYSVVGLQVEDRCWVAESRPGRTHSRDILPTIVDLLKQADITFDELHAITFGQGPGSFTGLRIATGVVQGLGYGLQIPVVPVSTLAILAMGEHRESGADKVMTVLFARKEEVYAGAYWMENGLPVLVGKERVVEAMDLTSPGEGPWVGVGDGWKLREKLERALGCEMVSVRLDVHPRAEDLLKIAIDRYARGEWVDAMEATPEYLREQVASVSRQ